MNIDESQTDRLKIKDDYDRLKMKDKSQTPETQLQKMTGYLNLCIGYQRIRKMQTLTELTIRISIGNQK